MFMKRIVNLLVVSALFFGASSSASSSRIWKATPQAISRDYVTIQDNRGPGDLVFLIWFVPQMLPSDAAGSPMAAGILDKYALISLAHGHFDMKTGAVTFDEIDALQAKDQSEKPLTPVQRDALPPAAAGMLVAMEAVFRQSLGALGKGTKTFVFDAGSVRSCGKGRLAVLFAGETYTWDTPIPGCS